MYKATILVSTILEKSGWMCWGQYGSWLAATSAYQKWGPCR